TGAGHGSDRAVAEPLGATARAANLGRSGQGLDGGPRTGQPRRFRPGGPNGGARPPAVAGGARPTRPVPRGRAAAAGAVPGAAAAVARGGRGKTLAPGGAALRTGAGDGAAARRGPQGPLPRLAGDRAGHGSRLRVAARIGFPEGRGGPGATAASVVD